MTWTSEMSGTASSGVFVIAQMPHRVTMTVPVNTRNRFDAHQSMIRSIMTKALRSTPSCSLLHRQRELFLADALPVLHDVDGDVPCAGHHHVALTGVRAVVHGFQLDGVLHLRHLHRGHCRHDEEQ